MLEAGVDILELQKILGHVSILSTIKYTHLTTVTQLSAITHINRLVSGFNINWVNVI